MDDNSDDICRNRHGGNPESVEAHEDTRPNKHRDRGRVVRYLEQVGHATCDEIEVALGMWRSTASARVSELLRDGLIIRRGDRRPTRTGSNAAVLILKPETHFVTLKGEQESLFVD